MRQESPWPVASWANVCGILVTATRACSRCAQQPILGLAQVLLTGPEIGTVQTRSERCLQISSGDLARMRARADGQARSWPAPDFA